MAVDVSTEVLITRAIERLNRVSAEALHDLLG